MQQVHSWSLDCELRGRSSVEGRRLQGHEQAEALPQGWLEVGLGRVPPHAERGNALILLALRTLCRSLALEQSVVLPFVLKGGTGCNQVAVRQLRTPFSTLVRRQAGHIQGLTATRPNLNSIRPACDKITSSRMMPTVHG